MAYYNERNGWVDTGKKLNNRKCPKCRSARFKETLSREYCPDCGLECDYWGGGANTVYESMMKEKWAREEQERDERIKRQLREEWGDWADDYFND